MSLTPFITLAIRRLLRDKIGLFFVLIFPIIITTVIGFTFFRQGPSGIKVGIVAESQTEFSNAFLSQLKKHAGLRVTSYDDAEGLRTDIRRERQVAGLVLTRNKVEFLANRSDQALVARQIVASELVLAQGGQKNISVTTRVVGKREIPREFQGFSYPAASNLILFTFITSVAAASQLIDAKRDGLVRRTYAAPVSKTRIVVGTTAGRLAVAAFQAMFIFIMSSVLFDVDWGSPLASLSVIFAFSLVGAGVAMLAGVILKTAQLAGSIGPFFGIALGMLGGCMWPLEIVSPTMRTIGHFTTHAWAMDSFIDIIGRGAGVVDILPKLAILLAFAAVFLMFSIRKFASSLNAT